MTTRQRGTSLSAKKCTRSEHAETSPQEVRAADESGTDGARAEGPRRPRAEGGGLVTRGGSDGRYVRASNK